MHRSVWSAECELPKFEKLQGDKKTDVLIIGGGISGVLIAYFLQRAGIDYILAEGKSIASGITKNTTAKITSQHSLLYDKLIKDFGQEKARMYLMANENAIREYESICENIDCDFEKRDAYIYSLSSEKNIEKEVAAASRLGFKAELAHKTELPFKIKAAVKFSDQAQFNPLKFISSISKDLNIYENCFIRDITPDAAISDNGKIKAEKIIVATHFPFINKHGSYFMKLYQHRSYVCAYENAQELKGMYADENSSGLSFRSYGKLLFIGGGSHRTGKDGGAWNRVNSEAEKLYPKAELKYQWATQDCISLDGVPYIGRYSQSTPNLYVATGFNKWGFTSSMAAAKILCDMVQEKENSFAEVFSPQRSIIKPQLFANGFETMVNLLSPSVKRCPHLGCALKWNKYEHSWDCPCHGSRFERGGRLIDNPATGDTEI